MAGRRGSAKGERRGGRQVGTPNKATIQRNLIAARQAAEALKPGSGKKLAKEVLEEFMLTFAGMAATYQPMPPGRTDVPDGRAPDPVLFRAYAELAVLAAAKLAPFQSPTFRAIAVTVAQEQVPIGPRIINNDPNVISIDDPLALQRVYRLRIAGVR